MQDHERAYFDSADWVLGKVNDKSSVQYSGMHVIRLNLTLYPGVPSASCKQQRFKGRGWDSQAQAQGSVKQWLFQNCWLWNFKRKILVIYFYSPFFIFRERLITSSLLASQPAHQAEPRGKNSKPQLFFFFCRHMVKQNTTRHGPFSAWLLLLMSLTGISECSGSWRPRSNKGTGGLRSVL